MIVAGVKHACATCIRGHRSSSCTHVDRQLFEIRKKGRPVSQCPHCRDLRKIKSCHTKCECGETPDQQSKTSTCKCHTGRPCICSGPLQVYQFIPPELTNDSSTTDSTQESEAQTPNPLHSSMLHTFRTQNMTPNKEIAETASTVYANAAQLRTLGAMPYSTYQSHLDQNRSRLGHSIHSNTTPSLEASGTVRTQDAIDFTGSSIDYPLTVEQYSIATKKPRYNRIRDSNISRSTRSIGINTEPLPPGIWPENLFEVPEWQSAARNKAPVDAAELTSTLIDPCPRASHMPFRALGFDPYDLAASTNPVPNFSAIYQGQRPVARTAGSAVADTVTMDHYVQEETHELDTDYLEALFDVPGCSLPGVACRCGDGCSCAGCQTHKNNTDNVTFAEFDRMDVANAPLPPRPHPEDCCDTRSIHGYRHGPPTGVPSREATSCCGG